MAEKNSKLTPFEKQQAEAMKQIKDYKIGAEASIVAMIYKNPDLLRENNIEIKDFHNNIWRVYFEIARDLILNEKKITLSETDVILYLEKHPELAKKYDEYEGYQTIEAAGAYHADDKNFDSYIEDLRKWNAVVKLISNGFPCDKERISSICDMSLEELYDEYTINLNDTFANVDNRIQALNGFEGMHEFIDELAKGKNHGIDLWGCDILTEEIGGLLGGNIYGIGASSGVGKSTILINYIFPAMMNEDLRAVFIINEEDETKFKREALVWYCTNELKHQIQKRTLRDGTFTKDDLKYMRKAADWFESLKDRNNITIIPLERYTAKTVVKLIKKYTKLDVDVICIDTLKESADSRNKESWKSLMTDCVDFYDCIKHTNTAMVITYQLTKNKSKYLTNADIGVSKGIVDVFSVNMFLRRPLQTEFEGSGNTELYCYNKIKNSKNVKEFKLKKDGHYMICFIDKNRFGQSGVQIVSEADFSVNKFRDIGYCKVVQDY